VCAPGSIGGQEEGQAVVKSIVDIAIEQHPVDSPAPGSTFAGYTIGETLGEGLLGPVFAVTDGDGVEGALKILRDDVLDERMSLEVLKARVGKAPARPGTVVPRACGEENDLLWVEMERVPGRTLKQAIAEAEGPLPLSWIEQVFTSFCDRLVSLRPETHGHLGPEHVMIVEEPVAGGLAEVRILGWGRSWMLDKRLIGEDGLPEAAAWRKAPEETSLGARRPNTAQVWAVGVLLYEALTGTPPQGSYELPSALRNDVPEAVDDIIDVALSFSAADRFPGVGAFAVELENAFASSQSTDRGPATRTLAMVAGFGVAVLALVFGFIALRPTEEDRRADEAERRDLVRAALDPGRVRAPGDPPQPGMRWVPPGKYLAGRFDYYDDEAGSAERDETTVQVGSFWIDELPFVNPMLNDPFAPPLTEMTFVEAGLLCAKYGKRLCTEDEWEKACRGPRSLIFSYGDAWDPEACPRSGFFEGGYRLSDYPACVSGYGVVGMSGGVGEWTSSKKGDGHVIKPAEAESYPKDSRCAGRTDRADDFKSEHLGMRCCHDS
jgi:hypothetical protein